MCIVNMLFLHIYVAVINKIYECIRVVETHDHCNSVIVQTYNKTCAAYWQ